MNKEENVMMYYAFCSKLKDVIRAGWKTWNVKRERLESVAEHIYSAQMLAIAMKTIYHYDVDIMKVSLMLAVHELGEIKIGDNNRFDMNQHTREYLEHEAAHKILGFLIDGKTIEDLYLEFENKSSKEALFAYQCDKLDWELQSKLYDEEGCVDLNDQKETNAHKDKIVRSLLDNGASWSEMCLKYGQAVNPYDENFKAVSDYAINNEILKKLNNLV